MSIPSLLLFLRTEQKQGKKTTGEGQKRGKKDSFRCFSRSHTHTTLLREREHGVPPEMWLEMAKVGRHTHMCTHNTHTTHKRLAREDVLFAPSVEGLAAYPVPQSITQAGSLDAMAARSYVRRPRMQPMPAAVSCATQHARVSAVGGEEDGGTTPTFAAALAGPSWDETTQIPNWEGGGAPVYPCSFLPTPLVP